MNGRIDPITFAVIRNGFVAAAHDMYTVFRRTAMLPLLYEFNDFGMALFDHRLNMLSDAPGLPVFIGSLDICGRDSVESVESERWSPRHSSSRASPKWRRQKPGNVAQCSVPMTSQVAPKSARSTCQRQ